MLMPPVSRHMSLQPWTIRRTATLHEAVGMMREHQIRHLPVLDGGKLVGVVSIRDIHLVEGMRGVDFKVVTVEEAMTSDVYAVREEAPLDKVLEQMADRKLGSAIIVDRRDDVRGIFTTIDAMRALCDLLRRAST